MTRGSALPVKDRPVNLMGGTSHLNGERDAWAKLGDMRVCRNGGCPVHLTPKEICRSCHTKTERLSGLVRT